MVLQLEFRIEELEDTGTHLQITNHKSQITGHQSDRENVKTVHYLVVLGCNCTAKAELGKRGEMKRTIE
jgi:hypothetical protein